MMRELIESLGAIIEASPSAMSSKAFVDAVVSQAKSGVGNVAGKSFSRLGKTHEMATIEFINAPQGKRGGASGENNRFLFFVEGFGKGEGEGPPTGKVKIEQSVHSYHGDLKRMRGKTAPPEKMVAYLVKYINEAAKREPKIQ